MIYTSNYFNVWKKKEAVAISQSQPKGWNGVKYQPLMPHWSMVKMKDWDKFQKVYREKILNKLDVHQVAKSMSGKILLCYEDITKGNHCHRELVSEWFNENGYKCKEYPQKKKKIKLNAKKKEVKKEKIPQQKLI